MNLRFKTPTLHYAHVPYIPALDLTRTVAKSLFRDRHRPWEAVFNPSAAIVKLGTELDYEQYDEIAEGVWVHISAYLAPTAKIEAPAIICGGAKICHHTVVGRSVIGSFCTVGEMSSVKNSITFDRSSLRSHNSISHSILGYESILGEGAIVTDARLDGLNVTVATPNGAHPSSHSRLGAIICDGARIGAACIISPGSIIDSNAQIPPLSSISGYIHPYANVKR